MMLLAKQAIATLILTLVLIAGAVFASERPHPKAAWQPSYCPSEFKAPDGWALYFPCAFVDPEVVDL